MIQFFDHRSNTMVTVLQSTMNELNTGLVQLHTALRGLQTDADGAGIAIDLASGVEFPKISSTIVL